MRISKKAWEIILGKEENQTMEVTKEIENKANLLFLELRDFQLQLGLNLSVQMFLETWRKSWSSFFSLFGFIQEDRIACSLIWIQFLILGHYKTQCWGVFSSTRGKYTHGRVDLGIILIQLLFLKLRSLIRFSVKLVCLNFYSLGNLIRK